MPDIDVLDKKFTISLASLLISRGYIENNDQVNNIDWSKSSVYVSVIDKTGTKTDTLYEYTIDDAGILTISLDKFVNGLTQIVQRLKLSILGEVMQKCQFSGKIRCLFRCSRYSHHACCQCSAEQ